jgi:hypothetical protein
MRRCWALRLLTNLSVAMCTATLLFSWADRVNLAPFYEEVAGVIRAADPAACFFFESVTWDDIVQVLSTNLAGMHMRRAAVCFRITYGRTFTRLCTWTQKVEKKQLLAAQRSIFFKADATFGAVLRLTCESWIATQNEKEMSFRIY